jgi:2-hydroxy-3-oxopropionate reductase
MAKIGFIWLGIMGGPMALNLQKGGHHLFLYSRSGVKERALLDGGGTECASPAELAKAAEFIITMLPNTPGEEAFARARPLFELMGKNITFGRCQR